MRCRCVTATSPPRRASGGTDEWNRSKQRIVQKQGCGSQYNMLAALNGQQVCPAAVEDHKQSNHPDRENGGLERARGRRRARHPSLRDSRINVGQGNVVAKHCTPLGFSLREICPATLKNG